MTSNSASPTFPSPPSAARPARALIFLACGLLLPTPGRAELLFYEGFDYAPGEDAIGAAAGWTGTGNLPDAVEGSLGYRDLSGNVLRTSGNSALADGEQGSTTVSVVRPVSLVANDPGGVPGTRWLSFTGRQTSGSAARFFNVVLRAPDNTIKPDDSGTAVDEVLAAGMPSGQPEGQLWRVWDRVTGNAGWGSAVSQSSTKEVSFVLVKMEPDADGVRERFTIWVNPALDREPDAAAGYAFLTSDSNLADWSQIQDVRIGAGAQSGGNPGSAFHLDELRIGTAFADVTPYIPAVDLTLTRQSDGLHLDWTGLPGYTDEVQWSDNMTGWTTFAAGTFTPPARQALGWISAPLPGRRYFRIRRSLSSP